MTRAIEWCDGSGPDWGDVPCGAEHVRDGATEQAYIEFHSCEACGTYTPGAECHDGGLCDECSAEVSR